MNRRESDSDRAWRTDMRAFIRDHWSEVGQRISTTAMKTLGMAGVWLIARGPHGGAAP